MAFRRERKGGGIMKVEFLVLKAVAALLALTTQSIPTNGFHISPGAVRPVTPYPEAVDARAATLGPTPTHHPSMTKFVVYSTAANGDQSDSAPPVPPANDDSKASNRVDDVLGKLTSAFPFFVLSSAILGYWIPPLFLWTTKGSLITAMLALVMCATGLTLEKKDFTKVLDSDFAAVPAGVACQYGVMPLAAFFVGRALLLPLGGTLGPTLFLGLILVGCSPGGTASNLVSLIAKADVALSVLLTSASTLLASFATPLLVKGLVGSTIRVSGWALCSATAKVVLAPVLFGMWVNARAPNLAQKVSRFTPFCSVILVSLICGGVVAENAFLLAASSASTSSGVSPLLIPRIVASVLGLHCLGFLVGYLIPKLGFRFEEKTSRTISIETGMQNSALAVVLAKSMGADPLASLPGALSATAHSCLGSVLAAFWRSRKSDKLDVDSRVETPDDYPELLI